MAAVTEWDRKQGEGLLSFQARGDSPAWRFAEVPLHKACGHPLVSRDDALSFAGFISASRFCGDKCCCEFQGFSSASCGLHSLQESSRRQVGCETHVAVYVCARC